MTAGSPIASTPIGGLMTSLEAAQASSTSAGFYEDIRDGFAKEAVAQYATGVVTLVKLSAVAAGDDPYNPFDGAPPLRTNRNALVFGFETDDIDGAQIMASDRRIIMDAADFNASNKPAGDDRVEIDGVLHTMVNLKPIPAAGPAVLYIMQARTAA